jgi:hypothetical protein
MRLQSRVVPTVLPALCGRVDADQSGEVHSLTG